MDYSVIIPTFNRLDNLKLVLAALEAQQESPDWEVIISDDGSTDGTRDFFKHYSGNYRFPIKYQWCGPNLGFNTSRTRNIGMAQAEGKWAILLDSDVLLNPRALHYHIAVREAHPNIVIIGLYHFAEKGALTEEQVRTDYSHVMALVPDVKSLAPPVPGWDFRTDGFHDTFEADKIINETQYDGLGFFSGNISWPIDLWWQLGGQDEKMPSGQGEDAELGQRMKANKVPVLEYKPIYGIHLPHFRDTAKNQRLVQESITYIDSKHGLGTYAKLTDPETDPREKNLSIWYTRKQGAIIVKKVDEPTVCAVMHDRRHYVGLPKPWWINHLGFNVETDLRVVDDAFFGGMENMGVIQK